MSNTPIYKFLNEKKLILDEIEIAYHQEGEGEVIILLHGWPQTSYMWRKVIPILSKNFRVIALDLPGLGNSSDTLNYDTKNIATIINDFRNKLGIKKFHLIGHDIGAWVATSYSLFFEEYLNSLVIIDAGIPGLIPDDLFKLENANKVWQFYFHSLDSIPEFLTKGKEKEYISWYFEKKSYIKNSIKEEDIENYYLSYIKPNKMRNGFEYYRYFEKSALQNKKQTSKISTKILAIGGEFAVSEQVGIAMKKISNNVVSSIIKECGHYVPEEKAEELCEIINSFILSELKKL
ncbi:alpha/beta fold hydrolase [Candidatus Marinarcus aquaticus]|uniref:Alpha/beta hydrolase n=1 Tax=Candidatus Marinarcus aquaticus TaxID=2044504 RepID=A0A4Q0XMI3_9BACT|nr:alpha/beta hydrolase [Candidatus Marinarcus aquaticus]RXJ54163.1 alpha/beta hydrolase [Candidatus Marinarcus aquaticus]